MPSAMSSNSVVPIVTRDTALAGELQHDVHLFSTASVVLCWPESAEDIRILAKARWVVLDSRTSEDRPLLQWLAALPLDCRILVISTLDYIDRDFALFSGRSAQFVIGLSRAERLVALADLFKAGGPGTAEGRHASDSRRLHGIAAEIAVIAQRIVAGGDDTDDDPASGFADQRSGLGDPGIGYRSEDATDRQSLDAAPMDVRRVIGLRRLRDRFFDAALFADPAWDILLDLYAARQEGTSVSVSSLCIATAVPPTTALRWIGLMTDQALLTRQADPNDARRVFIALTDSAIHQMEQFFLAARSRSGLMI